MQIEEARELFAFNRWANARVLEAASVLSAEAFTRDMQNSFPSVRDTLVHLLSGQWIWLQRWKGSSPDGMPVAWRELEMDSLKTELAAIDEETRSFVESLSASDLDSAVQYRTLAGEVKSEPLGWQLRHVVNHSSYHRGQVVTMLRQLGASAPSTDLIAFYRLEIQSG
jgi:uncharacterized damage-inducible protein DinB